MAKSSLPSSVRNADLSRPTRPIWISLAGLKSYPNISFLPIGLLNTVLIYFLKDELEQLMLIGSEMHLLKYILVSFLRLILI